MRGCHKALRLVLVSGAIAVVACDTRWSPYEPPEKEELPVELVYEGEHVRASVQEGLTACGWSFEYLDRFAELYIAESADGTIDQAIEYYVLDAETIHRKDVCNTRRACARGGTAYAQSPTDVHEVVHAVRQRQLDGSVLGIVFFEEGLAQMHFPVDLAWDDAFRPSDVPEVVGETIPARLYDPAAHLMTVIAQDASFETAERFVDASSIVAEGDEVPTLIETELAMTMDELDALYIATPNCSAAARARMLVECAATPEEWAEAAWSPAPFIIRSVRDFDCDNPSAIGPLEGRLWTFFTVDIPSDGLYELDLETEPGQQLQLTSCDAGCGADIDLLWDSNRKESVALVAGRHVLRLSREVGDAESVAFQLSGPLPP